MRSKGFVYIATEPDKFEQGIFKVGFCTTNKKDLISRYITAIPKIVILNFIGSDDNIHSVIPIKNASQIEAAVKEQYYEYRINGVNGNKSEWLCGIDYEIVKNFILEEKNNILNNYIENINNNTALENIDDNTFECMLEQETKIIINRKMTLAKFSQSMILSKQKSIDFFIRECCILDKKYKIQSSTLHKQYIKWYHNLDEKHELKKIPFAKTNDFSPHIMNKYNVEKKKQSVNILHGITTLKQLGKDEIIHEQENIYSEEVKELKKKLIDQDEILEELKEEIKELKEIKEQQIQIQKNIALLFNTLQKVSKNQVNQIIQREVEFEQVEFKIDIPDILAEKNKTGKRKEKENLAHLSGAEKKERKKLITKLNYYETKPAHTNTDKSKIAEIYEELQKYDIKNYHSDEKIFM